MARKTARSGNQNSNTAIGYVRVSTEEQSTEGVSLAAQEARIRAYCEMRGLELVELVIDAGVSAGKPLASREGGAKVLDALRTKRAHAVVALKLDRCFRNATDCLTVVEAWDRAGIAFHLVDMGGTAIDTSTAVGKLFLTMLAGMAEFERNQIRERTSMAMQHKIAQGEYIGGDAPYGYSLVDGALVANESEQAVITTARELAGQGMSLRAIAKVLAERGHATRKGTAFAPTQVSRMVA